MLRQKYSDAEAQALVEAENLQDEIRRREELEKLHSELQQLLLAEKEAREAEAKAKALQDELLLNEKKRLEEMEKMKAEKEKLLQEELKKRESLEERQKLQDKLLEEVRTEKTVFYQSISLLLNDQFTSIHLPTRITYLICNIVSRNYWLMPFIVFKLSDS